MNTLQILKEIDEFRDVPEEQLQWLIDEGEILRFEVDDYLFKPGDPIDKLMVVLEGKVLLKVQQGNQFRIVGSFESKNISGYLPYSRADKAQGFAQITQPTTVLILEKSRFKDMIINHEELTTALVHTMSTRIREFTQRQQQNDKIMALGKLSAGLAHELNNPSAAVVRGAQTLSSHLRLIPENFKKVIKIKMTDEQVDTVNGMLFEKIDTGPVQLSMMDRSEREEEIIDWLEELNFEDADDLSEIMVDYGFSIEDLEEIGKHVSDQDMEPVINWLGQLLTTERIVAEIEEASSRINELVSSVKSYTHMDQAPEKTEADIHLGIRNTLKMLDHKIRKAGVQLVEEYDPDLPKACILVSEMNQVWTNIIDNALDAMENAEQKQLTVRTCKTGDFINVYIADTGSGIPEEAQSKIFDPFYTTKPIGKGTGLGMEVVHQIVVRRHNGDVTFETKPGHTEFRVCFPIKESVNVE